MSIERTIDVGGELISVPADHNIDIGFADILEHEASQDRRNIAKVPLSNDRQEVFPSDVLSNLVNDIHLFASYGKQPNEIFRQLALRYHSDFYAARSRATIDLAGEYTKAIIAMRQRNLIEQISKQAMPADEVAGFQNGESIEVGLHEIIDINELSDFGIPGSMMRELYLSLMKQQQSNPNDVLYYLLLGGVDKIPSVMRQLRVRQTNGLIESSEELSDILARSKSELLAPVAIFHNHTHNLARAYQSQGLPAAFALSPTAVELAIRIPEQILPLDIPHIIAVASPNNSKVLYNTYRLQKANLPIPYVGDTRCVDPRKLYDSGAVELLNLRINPGTGSLPQYNDLAISFIDSEV